MSKIFMPIIILLLFISQLTITNVFSKDLPFISRWFNNRDAALSLRFDDSLPSHVETVIPILNQYGFHATFMINPGLSRYKRYKYFWENEVPEMGHRLGNHTMHHIGALNLEAADYEIGKPSEIIWNLYPDQSKLLVFASGGGEKWGGEFWRNASIEYKKIVKQYYLIDLYDGHHPSFGVSSKTTIDQLCNLISKSIEEKKHQPLHFHRIGSMNLTALAKLLLYGRHLTVGKSEFAQLIEYIDSVSNQLWVAPLVQILKYEEEFKSAKIDIIDEQENLMIIKLTIDTDADFYDQKLTLVIPANDSTSITQVFQKNEHIQDKHLTPKGLLLNIMPINSLIHIHKEPIQKEIQSSTTKDSSFKPQLNK